MDDPDVENGAFDISGGNAIVQVGLAILQAGAQHAGQERRPILGTALGSERSRDPFRRAFRFTVIPVSRLDRTAAQSDLKLQLFACLQRHITGLDFQSRIVSGQKHHSEGGCTQ